MDAKLKQFLDSANYLPDFMRDFHDQKNLFKRLDAMVQNRDDRYTENINWIAGQVYTIDVFLWYMAKHGYTLQKNRSKVPFEDISEDLNQFEAKEKESHYDVIKSIISEMEAKKQSQE